MSTTLTITEAKEDFYSLTPEISLWYRTWGTSAGIPVLFVHGGPGASVAGYKDINAKFFEPDRYFVVEIDQRGTGKSTPSVRENITHVKHYMDISIAQMSDDFERIRKHLKIEKWLVFGGSWGSTLGLDYAERYPDRCLGLILRGIYLNTKQEFDQIYARKSFNGDERRTKEFDIFWELAKKEADKLGQEPLDPNDAKRFIQLYEQMIIEGNRDAIWRLYVFENNLTEEDPKELLDPYTIGSQEQYAESMSVSFFETRLFLHGTFEEPTNLLGVNEIRALKEVPTWVCQGTGDEVCPEIYAQNLCARLEEEGVIHTDHFVAAGHKASSDGMTIALKQSVDEFWERYGSGGASSSVATDGSKTQ